MSTALAAPGKDHTMTDSPRPTRACWCGATGLAPFSAEYSMCQTCGTLVSQVAAADPPEVAEALMVERAATELPRPGIHRLRLLLRYCLPPGRVLELNCGHGAFVSLLRAAGFDAAGLDLDEQQIVFGQQTFEIPGLAGPLETHLIEAASLSAVVLHDALERAISPVELLCHSVRLLRPGGVLMIRQPQGWDRKSGGGTPGQDAVALEMLSPRLAVESCFLFHEASLRRLLGQVGFHNLVRVPVHADEEPYLFAARHPLKPHETLAITEALRATVSGRWVEGWLATDEHSLQRRTEIERLNRELAARHEDLTRAAQAMDVQLAEDARLIVALTVCREELDRYRRIAEKPEDMAAWAAWVGRVLTRIGWAFAWVVRKLSNQK